MTITKFDKVSCRKLQEDCVAALQAVASKYGLSVQQAGGSLNDIEFKAKFLFKIDDPEIVAAAARTKWVRDCTLFNLAADDFGRKFICQGKEYQITGLDMGRRSKPIQANRTSDGRSFIFTVDAVKRFLGQGALVSKFELIKAQA